MRPVWLPFAFATAACGRLGFDDLAVNDAPPMSTALVVSVAADRLAGPTTMASIDELTPGTVGLSLREALAIATNHAGPDTIVFALDAFPLGTPTAIDIASPLVVGGDGTTLDAGGAGVIVAGMPAVANTLGVTGNQVTITALELQGGTVGIAATGVSDLMISAVTIQSPAAQGITLTSATNASIADTVVDHPGGDGIDIVSSTDTTVARATITLSSKSGVIYGVWVQQSQRVHVLDSFIDPGTAWMVHFQDTTDSEIVGNVIVGGDSAIALTGTSQRTSIFRNVLDAPGTDSVFIDTTVSDTTVLNNTMYMCGAITDSGTNTTDTNSLISALATDFVDPASYDFHLVPGSPSIDVGVDVGQDMLPGNPLRYLGAAPDLGGVESY